MHWGAHAPAHRPLAPRPGARPPNILTHTPALGVPQHRQDHDLLQPLVHVARRHREHVDGGVGVGLGGAGDGGGLGPVREVWGAVREGGMEARLGRCLAGGPGQGPAVCCVTAGTRGPGGTWHKLARGGWRQVAGCRRWQLISWPRAPCMRSLAAPLCPDPTHLVLVSPSSSSYSSSWEWEGDSQPGEPCGHAVLVSVRCIRRARRTAERAGAEAGGFVAFGGGFCCAPIIHDTETVMNSVHPRTPPYALPQSRSCPHYAIRNPSLLTSRAAGSTAYASSSSSGTSSASSWRREHPVRARIRHGNVKKQKAFY